LFHSSFLVAQDEAHTFNLVSEGCGLITCIMCLLDRNDVALIWVCLHRCRLVLELQLIFSLFIEAWS